MRAIKISDSVWWVGAIDWGLRDFHGYTTSRGSTYNAYLVMGDKITLVDAVKSQFKDEMLARISSVIDPRKISFIISNHSEMDHSGCLPELACEISPERIFASAMGEKALVDHFPQLKGMITAVKDGEKVELGGRTFVFYETKMLHWPDSMASYLPEDGILFSQDAFGMHLAGVERFDDEVDSDILEYEAKKYFANILTPYSDIVLKFADRLDSLRLEIKMIAPDHGPIWRKDIAKIVGRYRRWAAQGPTDKAVLVYDTMWQSTATMAMAVADGIESGGGSVRVMPLAGSNRSDIATELIEAGAFVVGSPTINNQMFPTVADALCYIKGLKFKNLAGASFGSYGWSGEAPALVMKELEAMKFAPASETLKVKYRPRAEDLRRCLEFGRAIGSKISGGPAPAD